MLVGGTTGPVVKDEAAILARLDTLLRAIVQIPSRSVVRAGASLSEMTNEGGQKLISYPRPDPKWDGLVVCPMLDPLH